MAVKRLGLISLLALATAQAAAAQTPTEIQPDTDPAKSLGTTVTVGGRSFTIDGGRRSGNNLFHSFATFTLGEGDTARWVHSAGNPATLSNIINRVTGGDPSRIFGTIDSTEIPNADFYFINPAGIVFGAGAQVNVPAAAHFSTATSLRFADGASFAISTPGGSTLSMAAPTAFGFIGGEAGISVANAEDGFLTPDARLTLSGADVEISDSSFDAGGLALFAVGSGGGAVDLADGPQGELAGTVSITDSFINLRPTATADGAGRIVAGDVTLDGSDLIGLAGADQPGGSVTLTANSATFTRQAFLGTSTRTGQDAGAVTVTVGDLNMFGGSQIFSRSRAGGRSGLVTIAADTASINRSFIFSDIEGDGASGGVDITASELLLFRSSITANASSDSAGNAGDIRIAADNLQLFTFSAVNSDAGGTGAGGTISLKADTLGLSGESNITADTLRGSEGAGGRVEITADILTVEEESFITADTFGAGPAGSVGIDARVALLDTGAFIASNALRGSGGNAGSVEVRAESLTLQNESRLSASTFSVGDAGDVSVTAGTLFLDGFSRIVSQANEESGGNAGTVFIDAGRLDVLNESEIATSTFSAGDAGLLSIRADNFFADGDAFIGSLAGRGSTGDAGVVFVEAGVLDLRNGTRLATTTFAEGDAGAVIVQAGTVRLDGRVFITSSATEESTGDAGGVSITADRLELLDRSEVASSTFSVGDAGIVAIDAGELVIGGFSFLGSNSNPGASGAAGLVTIQADTLRVFDRGRISSATFGPGHAGDIIIAAGLIDLDNASIGSTASGDSSGDAGTITIAADELIAVNGTRINSDTFGEGAAGDVEVTADSLQLFGGSFISSDTLGAGAGGSVSVTAASLRLFESSSISSDTLGSGDAGSVSVIAGDMVVASDSFVSSNATVCLDGSCASTGSAGIVSVLADTLLLTGGGRIASETLSEGDAGLVIVDARALTIEDGGRISSESRACADGSCLATGDAGGVLVTAEVAELRGARSQISSSTDGQGNAGLVFIRGGAFTLEDGASIQSVARAGSTGFAGAVSVELASSFTAGGGGFVSSSTLGEGDAGDVTITAPLIDLSGGASVSSASVACPAGNCLATGDAGSVQLTADELLLDRAMITSSTAGEGDAGFVGIDAGALTMTGGEIASRAGEGSTGIAGEVSITANVINLSQGALISSDTGGSGDAGGVQIEAGDLVVTDEARISSSTTSSGSAGTIDIDAGSLLVADMGLIRSETAGAGDAGFITIRAVEIDVDGASIASNATKGSSGNAGEIDISATRLSLRNEGVISSNTESTGDAGLITISADDVELTGSARIATSSLPPCAEDGCEPDRPGGNAGDVVVQAQRISLSDGGRIVSDTFGAGSGGVLSLTATDKLSLTDFGFLIAQTRGSGDAGSIIIQAGEVELDAGFITASALDGSRGNAGSVSIDADTIQLSNGSLIETETVSTGDAGNVSLRAASLVLLGDNEDRRDVISSGSSASGASGTVVVEVGDLQVLDNSSILAVTRDSGQGGSIRIDAGQVTVSSGQAEIATTSSGTGEAGDIAITADVLNVIEGGLIGASTLASGQGGFVQIDAQRVNVAGGVIQSDTSGSGDAGGVFVDAAELTVSGGLLSSDTNGSGRGGDVVIDAGQVSVIDGGVVSTAASNEGQGGNLAITSRGIRVASGGAIIADTNFTCETPGCGGRGLGGTITIDTDRLMVDGSGEDVGFTFISADALGSANAGSVVISAGSIDVSNGAFISSQAFGSEGDGGSVSIDVGTLVVRSNGFISSDARVSSGNAGEVSIVAGTVSLDTGGAIQSRAIAEDPLLTATSTGNAGLVRVRANSLVASNGGRISSSTEGSGDAGDVTLDVSAIQLDSGASIASQSERPESGQAGFVRIAGAQTLRLDNRAFISSSTFGAGDAGGVLIDARTVSLNRGAVIASQAGQGSTGEAGLVEIEANSVSVDSGASINTTTFSNRTSLEEGSGAVGIFADTVNVTGGGEISSGTFSSDNAGVVFILARNVTVDNGSISSAAREGSTGITGDVAVEARERLLIANGGSIETSSANNRAAGRLAIRAGDLRVEGADAEITSSNSSAQGAAGRIEIVQLAGVPGGGITLSEGASITTSARGGEAGRIDIAMAPGSILRLDGRDATSRIDTSSTGGGSGGQVTIGDPDTGVGNPFAVILNGGTITALGGLDAAFLSVNADYIIRSADRFNAIRIGDNQEVALGEYDVSSGITSKEVDVIDASRVLRGQCPAARASGQLSQFTYQPVGPYAAAPLPSTEPTPVPSGSPEGGC